MAQPDDPNQRVERVLLERLHAGHLLLHKPRRPTKPRVLLQNLKHSLA